MWPREMVFTATGLFDKENRACLSVMKSVDNLQTYFGVEVPQVQGGHVRTIIIKGYHYFHYIDENTTRYVNIMSSDPQIAYTPKSVLNFFMAKIIYQMLVMVQQKGESMIDEYPLIRERRLAYYEKLERLIKENIHDVILNDQMRAEEEKQQ